MSSKEEKSARATELKLMSSEVGVWMASIAEYFKQESLSAFHRLIKSGFIDGPPLGLRKKDADKKLKEWLRPIENEFAISGRKVSGKVIEHLLTKTTLPSRLAKLSRGHKTSIAGSSPRKRKGAPPAPWRKKTLALLKDSRRKLAGSSNIIILYELIKLGIIVESGDSYVDAQTNKPCAKNEKNMHIEIGKLKKKALNSKEIAKPKTR